MPDRPTPPTETMRAVVVPRHGGPEVLEIATRPRPVPGPGEVLLQVQAAGVNHLDTFVRRGMPGITLPLPMIPGSDAAGVVVALGPGAAGVKERDRVFVSPGYSCGRCRACLSGNEPLCRFYGLLGEHRDGTQAEYVALPVAQVLPLPAGVSFEAGAAFPLVFLTAWHMLVARAGLRPGEDVLIHAGGSGVGSAAIQIARLCGARVMTTVGSDDKIDFARALGADHVVNYRRQDFVEEAKRWTGKRGVDIVIEHIGGDTFERSVYALTRLGTLVTIGSHDTHWGRLDLRHVYSKNLRVLGTNLGSILELKTLLEHVVEGRLKPVVDRVFPLADARAAAQHVLDRKNKGKVVLVP